jgi:Flp pilus assembly protein TadD
VVSSLRSDAKEASAPAKPAVVAPVKASEPAVVPSVAAPAKSEAELSKKFADCMASANAARSKGDLDLAVWNFWRAAEAEPKSPAPYLGLAAAYVAKGETADASKPIRRPWSLARPPTSPSKAL